MGTELIVGAVVTAVSLAATAVGTGMSYYSAQSQAANAQAVANYNAQIMAQNAQVEMQMAQQMATYQAQQQAAIANAQAQAQMNNAAALEQQAAAAEALLEALRPLLEDERAEVSRPAQSLSPVAALRADDPGVGAVASFVGTVRDRNDGTGGSRMELEHYPGMTEKAIEAMIDEAQARFDIRAVRVVHRVGVLEPMDQIVLVAVAGSL